MRCGAARCGAITGEDAGCRALRRSACCASGAADLIADTVRSVPHIIRADEVSRSAAAAGARCAAIDGTTERLADYIEIGNASCRERVCPTVELTVDAGG